MSSSSLSSSAPPSFVCSFQHCCKTFTSTWGLKRHLRAHTGYKPFQCSYPSCDMRFVEKCALTRHEARHSSENPYACSFPGCLKAFKLKEYLAVHERVHQKEIIQPETPAQTPPAVEENTISKLKQRIAEMNISHAKNVSTLTSKLLLLQQENERLKNCMQAARKTSILPTVSLPLYSLASTTPTVEAEERSAQQCGQFPENFPQFTTEDIACDPYEETQEILSTEELGYPEAVQVDETEYPNDPGPCLLREWSTRLDASQPCPSEPFDVGSVVDSHGNWRLSLLHDWSSSLDTLQSCESQPCEIDPALETLSSCDDLGCSDTSGCDLILVHDLDGNFEDVATSPLFNERTEISDRACKRCKID